MKPQRENSADFTRDSNLKIRHPRSKKYGGRQRSNLNWIKYVRPFLKSGAGIYTEYKDRGINAIILEEAKCHCRTEDGKLASYTYIPESSYTEVRYDRTRVKVKQGAGWYCPVCGAGHLKT